MRRPSPVTRTRNRLAVLLATLLVTPLMPALIARATAYCKGIPTLGEAAKCGVFEVGTGALIIKSPVKDTTIAVDIHDSGMCMGNGAKASIKRGSDINSGNATLYFGPACDPVPCGPGVLDPMNWQMQDMSREEADAVAFAQALADLPATETVAGDIIGTSAEFTGNGGLNVISIEGKITQTNASETITLHGGSNDTFVINVDGTVTFDGGAPKVILDGVPPENVIWNIVASGVEAKVTGDGTDTFGMWVNIAGKITITGDSNHTGPFIAGNGLKILGNVNISGPYFAGCESECPSPEISGLTPRGVNIQTPSGPSAVTAENSNFYYSWFNPSTWVGHVEALRLDTDGTIIDAQDPPQPAVDPATNQLTVGHVPYWDAATQLAAQTSRTVYTTVGGSQVLLTTGNTTEADLNITAGDETNYPNYPDSGVDTAAKLHAAIVAYAHGEDAFDEDLDTDYTELRPSVLGDIFHSNPTLIGPPATPLYLEPGFSDFVTAYEGRDWVLYAGANDGMLHAFDAGETWDGVSAYDPGTGDEVFGYVPGLELDRLKLVPINSYRNEFYLDGPIVASDAWLGDLDSSGGKSQDDYATVLIASFRDGGPGYLALDITDPSATLSGYHGPYPKLLWEFTHAKLGKTWSQPIITRVKVEGSLGSGDKCGKDDGDGDCREQWVAIFGGGYEADGDPNSTAYIADPADLAWSNRSKALFVVALDTGAVLASVEFDATGATGPDDMKYSIPATPAVLDTNEDGFADLVYVGDLGGQIWKWDLSPVGQDTAGDARYDNWSADVFFKVDPVDMGGGDFHYRSFYATPAAAYTHGTLVLAIGSGERHRLTYEGDATKDDNNRFYVIPDATPTGVSFPLTAKTEADLTNVTAQAQLSALGALGFYFVAEEHEKFVTDAVIFSGYVLVASYKPDLLADGCGPGKTFFYAFRIDDATGYFTTDSSTVLESRRQEVGSGVSSAPRIKVARNPDNDTVYITTSEGEVLTLDPPGRTAESDYIYWKQVF
jgi:Tfp pilus tip-associated adhesin PilY1